MRKCLYCILMLFLSLTLSHTQAQNYPVQATPLLQPPYSLDLNDYQGLASKLRVQLLLRDLTKPSLEVYISLRLSGFGVDLQTNPSVAALNTFLLQPGVPLTISGNELSPLFAQMLAQGVNYDDLLAGISLPGGYYTWEVVAYLPDGRQVSNTGRASMSVFKAQPPQITFPTHNASILATGITTIPFQWISRSVTPASVLGTIYDMKIYELPDDLTDRDDGPPNVAVLSGLLPIFNTQTASTSYFYGPGDPLLQAGKRYAIVVQAQDIGGGDSYENQGLSQVVAFKVAGEPDATAQAACPAPTGLNIRQDDAQTLEVSWNPVAEATDYLLQFRKANEPWQSQVTTDNGLMLIQLSPAKYEVQVAARCTGGLLSYISPITTYDLMTESDSTQDEVEDPLSYYYEDEETPEPAEYEELEGEDGLDELHTPFTIIIDTEALPDSLKAKLPPGGSLPVLHGNPSIEQLKDAVKVKKTTCAAVIAGYTCGNHDAASLPSGNDYQPQPGDELAMNSIKIEVVEIDAAGNGLGIAHIKGFNNAKLGVEFKSIKVKEGGCIYAGEAITNNVDLALLNQKQRAALEKAYVAYNAVLDKIEENAEGVAETFNSLSELLSGVKDNAKNILKKLNSGLNLSSSEKNKLEALNKNAKSKLELALKTFDLQFPNTNDEFHLRRRHQIEKSISLLGNTSECIANNPNSKSTTEIKKGPNWKDITFSNPCTDSLFELAEFDFQLLQDNVALMEEEGKFAKEILDVTKFTLDVKNKSKENKPESLNLKPNFDLHLTKMQALADRFTAPKPEVDSKRYQVENVSLKLNGKTIKLKHFILGYEGDFTINLNEFSEENITDNAKDKLLFVGAQASKKELLAVHGTKKDVKMVYDYLSPKKGKLTGKQLYDIFVDKNGKHITPLSRCDDVAKLINKYADKFEITMPLRMAHFLGQIGTETGGLNNLEEIIGYSPRRVVAVFGKPKYAALFEGVNSDPDKCVGVTYEADGGTLGEGTIKYLPPPFEYSTQNEIVAAYAHPKTGITKSNLEKKGSDGKDLVNKQYNSGLLKVRSEFYGSEAKLFDVTYACRMGNRGPGSQDGSTFAGKGFIHLTGRWEYKQISILWNADPENANNKMEFHGKDIGLLTSNLDVAMKASMYYWKRKGLNVIADGGTSDSNINNLGAKINGKNPPEGGETRIKYTNKAYKILK